jgi:hypothetical protein
MTDTDIDWKTSISSFTEQDLKYWSMITNWLMSNQHITVTKQIAARTVEETFMAAWQASKNEFQQLAIYMTKKRYGAASAWTMKARLTRVD